MAETRAQANRRIRQEALREQLSQQGHAQHIIEILDEMREPGVEITSLELQKNKLIIDTKLALMKKYLPDVKQVEITGDPDNPVSVDSKWTIEVVSAESKDTKEA